MTKRYSSSIEEEAYRAAQVRAGALPPLPKPKSRRKIALANQKGGVGKTTTAVNLAWAASLRGMKVLVLDLDPQGNASTALAINHWGDIIGTYEAITQQVSPAEAIYAHKTNPNIFCMPATLNLAGAEIELTTRMNREFVVHQVLEHPDVVEMDFDYIFIDCPPSLGLLTINALTAANEIVIPIQCEFYALEGVTQLMHNVKEIRKNLNPNLGITGVLMTMFMKQTNLSQDVVDDVREAFPEAVFDTVIPRNVRVSEAPSNSQTVIDYDPGSAGAAAYLAVMNELAAREPEIVENPGGFRR